MENYQYPFEKLNAYVEARKFVILVYRLLKKFPMEEKYELCSQIRRASVSVPSNIAEGVTRQSYKEKIHFLNIAYGSLMETYCQFQIALDLGYITESEYMIIKNQIFPTGRLISGLRSSYQKYSDDFAIKQ